MYVPIFGKTNILSLAKIRKGFETSPCGDDFYNESANQANRALLNMPARYNTRMLAADIKNYFESNDKALEVLIFRRKYELSFFRRFALSTRFFAEFKKLYER
jgi:hypothetical protein